MPPRNPDFTGRGDTLPELRRSFGPGSPVAALHGGVGVGKTQVAVEYIYRYAPHYDLVWWIPAGEPARVPRQVADLAQLASAHPRWLLVLDDAEDPRLLHSLPSTGGHVIVTSRNPTWTSVTHSLEVDVFDRSESVALLRRHLPDIATDAAETLAERLGDLPLALERAGRWFVATGMPVSEYLVLLPHADPARDTGTPGQEKSHIVGATVGAAIHGLRERTPALAEFLELFAYLGPEPVSLELLRRGRLAPVSAGLRGLLHDPLQLRHHMLERRGYGLATLDSTARVHMSPAIRTALRGELPRDRDTRCRENVHLLLSAASPGDPEALESWPLYSQLAGHIKASDLVTSTLVEARQAVLDQMRYLYLCGDFEDARRLGEAAVREWSAPHVTMAPEADDGMALIATRHQANTLRALGEYGSARALGEEVRERLERTYGPQHPESLAAAGTVAVNLRIAGHTERALAQDETNLARHRTVFGEAHPMTLRAFNNVAVNLRIIGDFDGAGQIDRALVETWEESVGEDNHRLQAARVNLARDLFGLGRYTEALQLLRRTLPAYRQVLGEHHPDVLLADRTLAIVLRKSGKFAEALLQARRNAHDCVGRFGPAHEHSLLATMTYASTLRTVGDLAEARDTTTRAVDGHRRVFGDGHHLTLAATANRAVVLRMLGQPDEARDLDDWAYQRMARRLGPEHPYTLVTATNLASDLAATGQTEAALSLSRKTLEASQSRLGEKHPDTLACAVNLALDRDAVEGRAHDAERLRSTVASLVEVLGDEHPVTACARTGRRVECDIEPPPS